MESNLVRENDSPFWWAAYVPATLLILLIAGLSIFIGGPILVPLLLSFALAFMLEPLADWFQKRGLSRNPAVLVTLAVTILVILLVVGVLLPGVISQLRESAQQFPLMLKAASARLNDGLELIRQRLGQQAFSQVQEYIAEFQKDPSVLTSQVGGYLTTGLFGLVNAGSASIGLLIVPFFVYYLLLDMANIRLFIEKRIPERQRGVGLRLFNEIGDVVRGYVRGRVIIALILSVFYALGLWILGVPLWAAIGLIAGIVGIIPYIGIVTGVLLALGFAALDGAGAGRLLGVIAVFALAQPLEDYILTPKFIGSKLDLHPMLVFLALIVAGSLFGVLGLVLAIPVVGVVKVILRFFDELYLRSNFYTAPALAAGEIPGNTAAQRAVSAAVSDNKQERDADKFAAAREKILTDSTNQGE